MSWNLCCLTLYGICTNPVKKKSEYSNWDSLILTSVLVLSVM